ncbi:NAD-dependent epimerase/dehydratase family protein [Microbacterium sp. A8/3-1]|uniref:NAD-dependent epimerase/dehydratase family protein n=1 Tax=Microbacterium sp. A8/3-1 TaxID=3160749 RepID=A0AAU7W2Y5_9MICO
MIVLVTGATGLLGTALIEELTRSGHTVRVLVRDPSKLMATVPHLYSNLDIVTGNITSPDIWNRALPGVDGVIHAAAFFREYYEQDADTTVLHDTNVTALTTLISAAEQHAVPVIVHTSSTTVLAPGTLAHPAGRNSPQNSDRRNLYRASKVDAETAVQNYVRDGGTVRIPMILPGWMWGPADTGPTAAGRLYRSIVRQQIAAIPRAGNHIVDSRDVALGAVRALERGTSGERYVLAGRWTPLPDVAALIADTEQIPHPRTIPSSMAMLFAGLVEWLARTRRTTPATTRAAVRVLLDGHHNRIDSTDALKELGITFRPLEDTISDIAHWHHKTAHNPPDNHI